MTASVRDRELQAVAHCRRAGRPAYTSLLVLLTVTAFAFGEPPSAKPDTPAPFKQPIPRAAYAIEMVPIPAGVDAAGKPIRPFFMSRTEVTWDAFDTFAYRLDEPAGSGGGAGDADADSRPSKPYLPPDRGFGHEGYAAISITHKSATAFGAWLSATSGLRFRLATEDEWEHACRAGAPTDAAHPFGDAPGALAAHAWFRENADGSPQPVAKKKPNARGLHDMLGNVREWVDGRSGKPTTKGGCYIDPAEALTITAKKDQDRTWNQTDPQIPKSSWWLSDGPFAGFRIVCEMDPESGRPARTEATVSPSTPRPGDPPPATPTPPPAEKD